MWLTSVGCFLLGFVCFVMLCSVVSFLRILMPFFCCIVLIRLAVGFFRFESGLFIS